MAPKSTNWNRLMEASLAAVGALRSWAAKHRSFSGLNRGKRGISIDLNARKEFDLCLQLLDRVDVMVENFRPGTMDRLGLGYRRGPRPQSSPGLLFHLGLRTGRSFA